MLDWFSDASVFASCSKRATRIASFENDAGSTFSATSRPSAGSRARYTSPMPPEPIGSTISYDPNRVPGEIDICHPRRSIEWLFLPAGLYRTRGRAEPARARSTLRQAPLELLEPIQHNLDLGA